MTQISGVKIGKFHKCRIYTCEEPDQYPRHDRGHRVVVHVQKRDLVVLLAQHKEQLPRQRNEISFFAWKVTQ